MVGQLLEIRVGLKTIDAEVSFLKFRCQEIVRQWPKVH